MNGEVNTVRWALGMAVLTMAVGCEAEPYGTGPAVYDDPIAHPDDGFIFSSERINRIDLEIGDDALEILASQRLLSYPRDKVRAEGMIDGEPLAEVGVRLRGGLGSFTPFDTKPKLEIDLNLFTGDRFHGLESLSLNSMSEDCSGLVEAVGFAAYGKMGIPTSRTGYAQLFVNGEDYGLYLVVESQDDRWLKRNFEDRSGNLYDGKYVYSGYWPTIVDFGKGLDHWFDLEEGEDVDFEDIGTISREVKRAENSGQLSSEMWSLVDWEALMAFLLVEEWIINEDGYAQGPNNYRVYFDPNGPMVVIPWDLDSAFPIRFDEDGENLAVRVTEAEMEDWREPEASLARVCHADPVCRDVWKDLRPEVNAVLMDGELLALGEQLHALIDEGLRGDPRKQTPADSPCGVPTKAHAEAMLDYLATGEAKRGSSQGCAHTGHRTTAPFLVGIALALVSTRRRRIRG